MIIKVPFKFNVEGLREGRQRNGKYEVWEIAEIDIPVVSSADAPVAVTWDDHFLEFLAVDRFAAAEWGSHGNDRAAHTVYYDNSHWIALNESDNQWSPDPGPYPPCLFDDVVRKLATESECPLLGSHGFDAKAKRQVESCGNDAHDLFWDVTGSTREHRLRDLAKKASDLIVVDDRMYRRCIEPHFWIMQGTVHSDRTTAAASYQVAIVRVTTDEAAAKTPRALIFSGRKKFGLGEFDEALAHARRFNEDRRHGERADRINEARRPTITHTMAFDESAHVRSRVRELYATISKEFLMIPLGQMAKSTTRRFLDVDDLLREIGTDEGLLKFEEAAFALHSELSSIHNKQHHLSSLTEDLIDILENRDISIGDTIDPAKRTTP